MKCHKHTLLYPQKHTTSTFCSDIPAENTVPVIFNPNKYGLRSASCIDPQYCLSEGKKYATDQALLQLMDNTHVLVVWEYKPKVLII